MKREPSKVMGLCQSTSTSRKPKPADIALTQVRHQIQTMQCQDCRPAQCHFKRSDRCQVADTALDPASMVHGRNRRCVFQGIVMMRRVDCVGPAMNTDMMGGWIGTAIRAVHDKAKRQWL